MSYMLIHWLPILVASVGVWIVSSIVWMVLPHHRNDYRKFADEDAVQDALRAQNVTPGLYSVPHCTTPEEMKSEEVLAKLKKGPSALITIISDDELNMGKRLSLWFVQLIIISAMVAYVLGNSLPADANYLKVFQIAGSVSWMAYGAAYMTEAVWYSRTWVVAFKNILDALLYALVTAGVFGWLW